MRVPAKQDECDIINNGLRFLAKKEVSIDLYDSKSRIERQTIVAVAEGGVFIAVAGPTATVAVGAT
jgi:hypothetical protein